MRTCRSCVRADRGFVLLRTCLRSQSLPASHTCGFTLDLPAYSSEAALSRKLLFAITHCQNIDTDGGGGDRSAWLVDTGS